MKWRRLAAPSELPDDFKRKTRFLVDESLDPELADYLRSKGYNALLCSDFGLRGHSDGDVFARAWCERRVLLTHDRDFLDDTRFPEHRNPGVIVMAGGSSDSHAFGHAVATVIWIFGRAPRAWERSKIVISADGEMVIRARGVDGRVITDRYRVRSRTVELLED